jgi:ABC-type branched-subunit amino acid transport system ATPase component
MELSQGSGVIVIDNISKQFGGVNALDHCSFRIEAGRITGLIGPNGAGKTTLFNIIAGFIRPNSGRIWLDGEDVTGLPPHQLFQRGLVRTFQIPREFGRMTVLENLEKTYLTPGSAGGEYSGRSASFRLGLKKFWNGSTSSTCGINWQSTFRAGKRSCWNWDVP